MALSGVAIGALNRCTPKALAEVPPMQKILAIVLSLFATMTLVGIVVVITRTGASWPRSIRPIDWRRLTGSTVEDEPVTEESPAD